MVDYVPLGKSGLLSSEQGLGCMGMSEFYGAGDEDESLAVLARAYELGVNHFDTSDLYGRGHNETLIGRFVATRPRDRLLIASKFGVVRDPDGPSGSTYDRTLNNTRAYMRACCESSLRRLKTDHLDLYYLHRHDPKVPIEEIVAGMAELVREGKIRAIGLSEISADILKRAHTVAPIAVLQSEYSLFCRDVEIDILPTCRALGTTFLPYSPLGRGILTGRLTSIDTLDANDLRRVSPRFAKDRVAADLVLVEKIREIGKRHNATPAQVALAWLKQKRADIVPIPGTKRRRYLEENIAALSVHLSNEDIVILDALAPFDPAAAPQKWSTVPTERADS